MCKSNFIETLIGVGHPKHYEVDKEFEDIAKEGFKLDSGKVQLDLVPPEAILSLGEILTFGESKYSKEVDIDPNSMVQYLEKELVKCQFVQNVSLRSIQKECVGRAMKNNFVEQILNLLKDKKLTDEVGAEGILKSSNSWLLNVNSVFILDLEISGLKEETLLKNTDLQKKQIVYYSENKKVSAGYVSGILTPAPQCIWTMTIKHKEQEVTYAISATTLSVCLETVLKVLKELSSILKIHLPESLQEIEYVKDSGIFHYKISGKRNWEKGMDWGRCYAALQRHLNAWWGGESIDPESGKSHLKHALANIVFLTVYEIRQIGKDDRPIHKSPLSPK